MPELDGLPLLDRRTRLDEFEQVTALRVDVALRAEADTACGLLMAPLGRIPEWATRSP